VPRASGVSGQLSRYEVAWEAINRLIRTGGSWSGYERNCFFRGGARGGFANLSAAAGLDWIEDGRGLAVSDFDRDGDPDLVLKNRNAPQLRIVRNDAPATNARISVRLEGRKSNRHGIGARVEVEAGGARRVKELRAGSGFLSQNAPELFFGLGAARRVDRLRVRWPSGVVDEHRDLPPGACYTLREGEPAARRREFAALVPGPAAPGPAAPAPPASRAEPIAVGDGPATPRRLWLLDPAPMPRLELVSADGRPWDWRPFAAGPVVVTVGSPRCARCVRELVEWEEARRGNASGPPVVALMRAPGDPAAGDPADERAAIDALGQRTSVPIALAPPESLLALSITIEDIAWWPRELALPTSLLVDERGAIVRLYEGAVDWKQIERDAASIPRSAAAREEAALPFAGTFFATERRRNPFQLGVAAMEAGLLANALDAFRDALAWRPDDVESLYNVGLVRLELGDLAGAREVFSRAVEVSPEFVDAHLNLGVAGAREGRLDDASASFERVLALRAGHVEALLNLGNVELARGDPQRALAHYRQAAASEPGMSAAQKQLGSVYRRLGDLGNARAAYERATAVAPDDAEAWSNLGVILAESGDLAAGRVACARAIAADPEYGAAFNNAGLIFGALGDHAESVRAFERAIALEPAGVAARRNLAREHLRAGDTERARSALEDLLELAPADAAARELLRRLAD